MSASEFEDATQVPYFSGSDTESDLDSMFDIGTQLQDNPLQYYSDLDLDLGSQLLEAEPDPGALKNSSSNKRSTNKHIAADPQDSYSMVKAHSLMNTPSEIATKENPPPSPMSHQSLPADDTGYFFGKFAKELRTSPRRNLNSNSFEQTQPIGFPDNDDDLIFVSCQPRTMPTPRIKEEPDDEGDTWGRLSAIVAYAEPTSKGTENTAHDAPNNQFSSRRTTSVDIVEGDKDIGALPAPVSIPHSAGEIRQTRPRFVPKGDVVKKIQANLLKKSMEKTGMGTGNGVSADPTDQSLSREEHSSQAEAGKSQSTTTNVPEISPELIVIGDDPEDEWMNQDVEDEDDDSDAYEKLKAALNKTPGGLDQLSLEVELIAAERRKSLRDQRRRLGSNVEIVENPENSLFVQDFPENVHTQRKRAHEASVRYRTPYSISPEEIEEFEIDPTSTAAKKPRAEEESTAQATIEIEDRLNEVSTPPDTQRLTTISSLEQAQSDDRRSTEEMQMSLLRAISESRSRKTKKRAPRAKTAKEVHSRKTPKATKAGKSEKSPKASQGALGGKVTKKGSKASKAAKASKKIAKRKAKDSRGGLGDGGEDLLHSLFFSDAIALRQAQGEYGEAPVIEETSRKDRMLKELMASIPKDHKRLVTNDKTQVLKASKNFGYGRVKACSGKWLLKGMKTSLFHHQLLGADWMVKRELSSTEKGGILADAMGLGKTLQMLAVMVGNAPNPSTRPRTTLLVVPSSVIDQWQEEIKAHVEKDYFNHVLHYKKSKEIPIWVLEACDVIITSYTEVMGSCPFPSTEKGIELGPLKIAEELQKAWPNRGLLHIMKYYRVVLDESHIIKNHKSRTSIACYLLDAEYRWALSGTPIHNRIEEIFPYFRFLRVQYASDFYSFKKAFCIPDSEECNTRLLAILGALMIRRTLKDKMFNRPIVELPQAHTIVKKIDFSQEERCLYEVIEERFRSDFNTHLKEGTAAKHYNNMVLKLLRLRQLTAHPFLLQETIQTILSLEDIRKLEAKLNEVQQSDQRPLYEKVGQWVREQAKARQEDGGEVDVHEPETEEDSRRRAFGHSNFGSNFSFTKYLQTLDEKEMITRCMCALCHDLAVDPQITDCYHVFCKSCIQEEATRSAQEENEVTACPVCQMIYLSLTPWFDNLTAREKAASSASSAKAQDEGNKSKSGKKNSEWLNIEGELLPSAKTIALKATILEWMAEAPDEKIIIFTQFRLMARIIGKICKEEGWGFCFFTGDLSPKARAASVKSLKSDPNTRIMIAGLKCGGQGLNLTMACRVICIDLWWNHSVEQQAFGRVFRIGQANQTHLTRFVVRRTVDDRLLGMQVEKSKVVDGAMMDDGRIVPQLSVEELASLFGYLSEDENGDKIILPESYRPIN